jgi:hypothetical protein
MLHHEHGAAGVVSTKQVHGRSMPDPFVWVLEGELR